MNDATEPSAAPPTSAQEEAVRRALADAGGPVPLPGDVAARLDSVITGLAAERAAASLPPGGVHLSHPEAPAVVVPLDPAALRRRRRVRLLFGAAAAVAVVAVGVGLVSDNGAGSDDLATAHQLAQDDSARESAVAGAQAEDEAGGDQAKNAPTGQAPSPAASGELDQPYVLPQRVPTDEPVREVRADHLREDLVALQHVTLPHPAAADYAGATLTIPAGFICEPASFGRGYLVGVLYDGKPAVVAFRQPAGSTQEAEVLACGTGDVIHSTTLAATG
ncbi:hypothetical protein KVF89_23100 [Nocardioides carbamazepini]|uniref:hypothetical protein n=1 Tax=Nocardioides carbamazepini TaxID=2854259 RepID=UPI00214A4FEB|nr:hypothetical protein [Nocardioides carbamazepini]MCR1785444.1 hypothetical protein [Nocardioides carbamazepini]